MEAFMIFLLGFLALGGLYGGVAMLLKPDGSLLGMSTDMLKKSPVDDYFWPGIFLLAVMFAWPALNIVGILTDQSFAYTSTTLLGATCMGWIVYQLVTIKQFWFLQPVIFIIGLLLLILSQLPL